MFYKSQRGFISESFNLGIQVDGNHSMQRNKMEDNHMFDNGYKVCYLVCGTVQTVAEIQI